MKCRRHYDPPEIKEQNEIDYLRERHQADVAICEQLLLEIKSLEDKITERDAIIECQICAGCEKKEDRNEYRPWDTLGISELEYFKMRFIDLAELADQLIKALEKIADNDTQNILDLKKIANNALQVGRI